jgi:hypothetical protein
MTVDVVLSFKEFLETYENEEFATASKEDLPIVDGASLIELYSYQIVLSDPSAQVTVVIGHPEYTEIGLEAYTDFLLLMQLAINRKARRHV